MLLDGYSGFSQIPVSARDQSKTTFTCPFGTFAYRCMPFGLCNAAATFQRCMTTIFSNFCEKIVEVFMDNFSVYGTSFDDCLSNLDRVLQRCELIPQRIVTGYRMVIDFIKLNKDTRKIVTPYLLLIRC